VPRDWLSEAFLEVGEHFGAASFETQTIEGIWFHEGASYQDNLVRLVVDVPDTVKNRNWMKKFKARWKDRLKQVELWIVSYRIEIE